MADSENNKEYCRFGWKCHKKRCKYVHPTPNNILCRRGLKCPKMNCSYKHEYEETRMCRFMINCTTDGCLFRHPLPDPAPGQERHNNVKKNQNPRKKIQQAIVKMPIQNPRELKAIDHHKNCIQELRDQIESIIDFVDYNPDNEKEQQRINSLRKSAIELEIQLQVYYAVKSRNLENKWHGDMELREIYKLESRLSALSKRLEIEKYIGNSQYLIVEGETGSGKSTQIPQYLADHPRFSGKRILCTQPRKLAAITLAHRVAFEYAGGSVTEPGDYVGFHVGGYKRLGNASRIEFLTEGVMLEKIMKGGENIFKNVGCIIIDEAHERSLLCDLLLGTFKRKDSRWRDVMIIVTSATIDVGLFSAYFYNAPSVKIEGRCFPVDIIYQPLHSNDSSDIRNRVVQCALEVHEKCKKTQGDILCFLPGQEDVILAKGYFESEFAKHQRLNPILTTNSLEAKVMTLFGKQDPEEQRLVFEKMDEGTRKIVFATDVAETSITIDGVVFVIDSGIKKEVVFDPKRNISSLKVTTISRSSAIQRAGRSGRTQPGTCYRLYSEDDFENMNANTAPEIFCKPLSLAVLTLQEMNIDPLKFDWISAPSKDAMSAAKEELQILGAIDGNEKATELGNLICQSQQDPKLVRMVYRGCHYNYGESAVLITSILTVSNMFFWNGNDPKSKLEAKTQRSKMSLKEGDIVTMYRLFVEWLKVLKGEEEVENNSSNSHRRNDKNKIPHNRRKAAEWCKRNYVNGKAMFLTLTTNNDLLSIFRRTKVWKDADCQNSIPSNSDIQRLVLAGYFVQAARLIHTKNMNDGRQYHALQSDVSGKLDQRAAILNYECKADEEREQPKWIIYDKLFRHSTVIFPATSVIEESWLEEENPNFHKSCVEKTRTLPTELIAKNVSQECLRELLGKYFSNVDSLEEELKCSIGCDLESGRMTLCCTSERRPHIENAIQQKLSAVVEELGKHTTDMDHVGATRFVVGQGFEVTDVLFDQEFSTLYIRNIPKIYRRDYLKSMLTKNLGTMQLVDQNNSSTNNAIAKFSTKNDAKCAYQRLLSAIGDNKEGLTVVPKFGARKGTNQNMSCRLKLSWALDCSTGRAHIAFFSPEKANDFIASIGGIFPEVKITMAHGENPRGPNPNLPPLKIKLPPLRAIEVPRMPRGATRIFKYRFDTDAINNIPGNLKDKFQYKVTINNLHGNIDEHELMAILKPFQPKWIKIDRVKPNSDFEWKGIPSEEKSRKLAPLQQFIKTENEQRSPREFFDRNLWRAGIYIYFESNDMARAAYKGTDYNSMEKSFGQPHRLEIEFTHSISIFIDLYQHLENQFAELKAEAKFKGINSTEQPIRERSKFVIIRFQTWQQSNIRWIQEKLVELTSFKKVTSPNIELIFTWTGKLQLQKLMRKTFIHLNQSSLSVLVYGREEIKEQISESIKEIITELKSLELVDEPIALDKRKVNGSEKSKIEQICKQLQIKYHHFNGNRLYVSGKNVTIQALNSRLEKEKFCRSFVRRNFNRETCNLCFDLPDGKFITTSSCEHVFCLDCIQPMFEQMPPPFPVKCPACDMPMVLNDILKCATQSSLLKILEVSVNKYVEEHTEEICKCPRKECTQLLAYNSKTTGSKGGDFLFCDECVATYCVACSISLKKPIKSHEDDSCEDIQNGSSSKVSNHIRKIQETMFNLSCPRCKTVFYEFTGCAAVTCGTSTCKCAFCGLCLMDCGMDAHPHVRQCPKNPRPGDVFVGEMALENVHSVMKCEKVIAYLRQIQSQKTRKAVFTGIRKDLLDLGIKAELFSEVLNIPGTEDDSDGEENDEAAILGNQGGEHNEQRQQRRYVERRQEDADFHRVFGVNIDEQMEIMREIERARRMQQEVIADVRQREIQRQREIFQERERIRVQREREERQRQDAYLRDRDNIVRQAALRRERENIMVHQDIGEPRRPAERVRNRQRERDCHIL